MATIQGILRENPEGDHGARWRRVERPGTTPPTYFGAPLEEFDLGVDHRPSTLGSILI
jgi:hypothetical protein